MLRCQPPMDLSTFNFDGSPAARSAACTCREVAARHDEIGEAGV